jgi:hypothetical protein
MLHPQKVITGNAISADAINNTFSMGGLIIRSAAPVWDQEGSTCEANNHNQYC